MISFNRIFAGLALSALLVAGCGKGGNEASRSGDDPDSGQTVSVHSMEPSTYGDRAAGDPLAPLPDQTPVGAGSAGLDDAFYMTGRMPEIWLLDQWANSEPIRWAELRGKVVVVRFFEIGSEACQRTMPAMQQLYENFRDAPVLFVGVLNTSRYGHVSNWNSVVEQVRQWGVTFPIARDDRGATLQRWWLKHFQNVPRTPTFVIGPDGCILYVQPGPEFHPSNDLMFALCDRDYNTVRLAIQTALPQDVALRAVEGSRSRPETVPDPALRRKGS